uniref:Uncharacterized protein n=1 Tax=Anopheles dirus TaxID=7168 RepID=A0A182NW22_9DIPT
MFPVAVAVPEQLLLCTPARQQAR